jgi:hypothetical protein
MDDLSLLRNYMHAAIPLSCIGNISVVLALSLSAFGEIGSSTSPAPCGWRRRITRNTPSGPVSYQQATSRYNPTLEVRLRCRHVTRVGQPQSVCAVVDKIHTCVGRTFQNACSFPLMRVNFWARGLSCTQGYDSNCNNVITCKCP